MKWEGSAQVDADTALGDECMMHVECGGGFLASVGWGRLFAPRAAPTDEVSRTAEQCCSERC